MAPQRPPEDRAKDFLMRHILQNLRVPPPGWGGVVVLESKKF
jgi:hypothetical protein